MELAVIENRQQEAILDKQRTAHRRLLGVRFQIEAVAAHRGAVGRGGRQNLLNQRGVLEGPLEIGALEQLGVGIQTAVQGKRRVQIKVLHPRHGDNQSLNRSGGLVKAQSKRF